MRMTEIDYEGQPPIDGYAPGGFRVGGVWHEGSLILHPGGVERFEGGLDEAGLAPIVDMADEIDLVIIGQGAEIAPLRRGPRAALEAAGLGVEIMSTPSACRTYNVLLTEARRVAVVLVAL